MDIVIEDSNVENIIDDFSVLEERYAENTILKLTGDQVLIELTNLLYNSYKKSIAKRVTMYNSMFIPDTTVHLYDPLKYAVQFKSLKYVDEDFNLDDESDGNTEYVRFRDFLLQFRELQTSNDKYSQTMIRLANLMRPFIPLDRNAAEQILQAKDAVRVIGTDITSHITRALEEDQVEVIGFYNEGNPNQKDKYVIFDFKKYVEDIQSLRAGDNVDIYFNEFFFVNKRPVSHATGKVTKVAGGKVHISLSKEHGEEHLVWERDSGNTEGCYYIYKVDTPESARYVKANLLTTNILFTNIKNTSFILPSTPSQILYMFQGTYRNLEDINNTLKQYGVDIHALDKSFQDIIRNTISKRYPPLSLSKVPSFQSRSVIPGILAEVADILKDTYIDTDFYRYKLLHDDLNNEYVYILGILQRFIKQINLPTSAQLETRKQAMDKDILRLSASNQENKCKNNTRYVIAKVYTSLRHLYNDNNKTIYFDKQFDPTDYAILRKYASSSKEELEANLRKELGAKGLHVKDIEFEVRSILKQKRKIRPGDHCILTSPYEDYVYVRKVVNDEDMWVKVTRLPFKVCSDDIAQSAISMLDVNTLDTTCVVDTYDNVCKSVSQLITNAKYNSAKSAFDIIKDVVTFKDSIAKINDQLNKDLLHHRNLAMIKQRDTVVTATYMDVDIDDEVYGDGNEGYEDDRIYQDQSEKEHYALLHNTVYKEADTKKKVSAATEILSILCQFTGVEMTDEDFDYITSFIKEDSNEDVAKALANERRRLEKGKDPKLYEKNKDYRERFERLVNSKIDVLKEKLLSEAYHNVIVKTIAVFALYIMSVYPNVLIKDIYPSCLKFLSYQSYPVVEKDVQKMLSKYLCCLIKAVATNDIRFKKIEEITADELHNIVLRHTDEILKDDVSLALKIKANKGILLSTSKKHVAVKETTLVGFRPYFQFDKSGQITDKIALYLYTINDIIRNKKHNRNSILNTPVLMNSCCTELLTNDVSYYTFLEKSDNFKNSRRALPTTAKPVNRIIRPKSKPIDTKQDSINEQISGDVVFAAYNDLGKLDTKTDETPHNNMREAISRFMKDNVLFEADDILADLINKYDNNDYWDDVVFPQIISMVDTLFSFVTKHTDTYDQQQLDIFKTTIVWLKDFRNANILFYVLLNYIKFQFRTMISKIANGFKFSEETMEKKKDDPEVVLLGAFLRNNGISKTVFQQILQATRDIHTLEFSPRDSDIVIKNMTLLNYILFKMLIILISKVSGNDDITSRPTPESKLGGELVNFVVSQVIEKIRVNDIDIGNLKKKEDEARERKKEAMIGLYKIDDEQRRLQIALREIGVNTWFDVGGDAEYIIKDNDQYVDIDTIDINTNEKKDVSISKHRVQKEVEENYLMTYEGENSDRMETDGDYPSQSIFFSDRDV
jgi:hypothetical protein